MKGGVLGGNDQTEVKKSNDLFSPFQKGDRGQSNVTHEPHETLGPVILRGRSQGNFLGPGERKGGLQRTTRTSGFDEYRRRLQVQVISPDWGRSVHPQFVGLDQVFTVCRHVQKPRLCFLSMNCIDQSLLLKDQTNTDSKAYTEKIINVVDTWTGTVKVVTLRCTIWQESHTGSPNPHKRRVGVRENSETAPCSDPLLQIRLFPNGSTSIGKGKSL